MKLMPWRSKFSPAEMRSDFDTLMDMFHENWDRRLPEAFRRGPVPPVNMAETETEVMVTVELPGLDEDDIDVQLMGDQLVISGERKWEDEDSGKDYYQIESQYGVFRRALELPKGLRTDTEDIKASYEKGVLTVRILKVEPNPAIKVKIKSE